MQPQDRHNFENFLNKVHKRLQPYVLKNLQKIKKKRIIKYLTSLFFSSSMIFYLPFMAWLKNITLLESKTLIIIALLMNAFYYIKCKRVLSYEKCVKNNKYYISAELYNYSEIIRQERLTSQELKLLFSLNSTEIEIDFLIDLLNKKKYFTIQDMYDLDNEEIIDDVNHWGMVEDKILNKSIPIMQEIEKRDKNLLLEFEKNNGIEVLETHKINDRYAQA